jgi:Uma2 family endonuclease
MTFTSQLQSHLEFDELEFDELDYPDCDGNPMSDNTEQFRWIVILKENLEILYAAMMNVFVAGDLLWYPVKGNNKIRMAPDAMVVVGRPKGRRGSYKQWEEDNIAPQIAFEVLSPQNFAPEMEKKRLFYEAYGVEEYYSYDPDRLLIKGWIRQNNQLIPIANMQNWVSPRMKIRFTQVNGELEIYHPNGDKFSTSIELKQQALGFQQALIQEQQRSFQAETQMRQLIINLLQSGMSTEQVAQFANCTIEEVELIAQL